MPVAKRALVQNCRRRKGVTALSVAAVGMMMVGCSGGKFEPSGDAKHVEETSTLMPERQGGEGTPHSNPGTSSNLVASDGMTSGSATDAGFAGARVSDSGFVLGEPVGVEGSREPDAGLTQEELFAMDGISEPDSELPMVTEEQLEPEDTPEPEVPSGDLDEATSPPEQDPAQGMDAGAPLSEPAVPVEPDVDVEVTPCDGVLFQEICWYRGELEQSCVDVCSEHGGPHSGVAALMGTPEQGGSPEHCAELIRLFELGEEVVSAEALYDEDGFGCHTFGDDNQPRWLTAPPYDPTSSGRRARLLCGCAE